MSYAEGVFWGFLLGAACFGPLGFWIGLWVAYSKEAKRLRNEANDGR